MRSVILIILVGVAEELFYKGNSLIWVIFDCLYKQQMEQQPS